MKPDKPFTPKTVRESTADYLSRQNRVSERRKRTLKCYFDQLCETFGKRHLHELTTVEVKDFADSKTWSPKTYNEVLGAYSLLYKEAKLRGWVPSDCNPCAGIKRLKLLPGSIGIFSAEEVRSILGSIKEDLIPFTAIWFFAGCRKEEVARLKWPQVKAALKSGVLEITGDVGQKAS
jgi:integrase